MNWPIGQVHLNVADLKRSVDFYQRVIGLVVQDERDSTVTMGAQDGVALLNLMERSQGERSRGGTGLYHFAILLPSRLDLARVLKHFADTVTPLQGLSDHYVSEAIYLADPEGNGIEIYRDRPRSDWQFPDGKLNMGTVYMDVDGVMGELDGNDPTFTGLPEGTIMGHVHLHVYNIPAAEHFYRDLLGMEVMVHYGGAASFVSWEGYHHHLGLNTWKPGAPSAITPNTLGLRWYEVDLGTNRATTIERLQAAGLALENQDEGVLVRDPVGNGVLFV
ncbi:MAG: VOC family protein [bacterium]|nr:VOC family protein [bacterium]